MKSILSQLQQQVEKAIALAYGSSSLSLPEITQSTQAHFGHYQCNNALKIAKELRLSPRDVAANLIAHWERPIEMIASLEVAGPGFINISLTPSFLARRVEGILQDVRLGVELPLKKEKVIVEFSSPNIAKELHVGHLRSTIIGDALARLFEFLGYDVLRLNHIGDWGTQFGMLIVYMQEVAPAVLEGKEETDLITLMKWYQASKKRFDEDEGFKKRSQLQVVKLQSTDVASLNAWRIICKISSKAFQEIYTLLDVKLEERGESFYNADLPVVIKELEEKKLLSISDGAKCLFLEGFVGREGTALPMIVQKSDGGYNYDTTDLAAIRHRIRTEKAERIIYVTDAGQSLHFAMLFKAAELAGYLDPKKTRVDHVPFGVVLGPDGKKFKTRSGQTEKLLDLLLEAVAQSKKIMQERLPELSEAELVQAATILGIDAVKYADLSCHRIKDYSFSYERMLKFEGNTAAFLLYAYVRIQGIKRKVGKDPSSSLGKIPIHLEHPSEIALALHLCQFPEYLEAMSKELLPNRLCDYLYELAEKFNAFFRDCRVEGTPEQNSRLLLTEACARVLQKGLSLIGVKTVDRM